MISASLAEKKRILEKLKFQRSVGVSESQGDKDQGRKISPGRSQIREKFS